MLAFVYNPNVSIDYTMVLDEAITEYEDLRAKRDDLETQIAKKFQFIQATLNLLPDQERLRYAALLSLGRPEEHGPTIAIKKLLKRMPNRWMTAREVRDMLIVNGFDFSQYKSNPLASVHSILKRLGQEKEIDFAVVDGVMAWKWKGPPSVASTIGRKQRVVTKETPRR